MLTSPQLSHLKHLLGYMACIYFTTSLMAQQEAPVAPSSMPCSRCRSWEENLSWHRCENACVNAQGIATLRDGREIRCSKSWDNNWWFFYCNRCKNVRPPLIGVLRGVKIERYNEQFGTYVTDSENSSNSCSEFDGTM